MSAGGFSFDDLAFHASGSAQAKKVCIGCLRTWSLSAGDQRCPGCSLPLRPVSDQEARLVDSVHTRVFRRNDRAMHASAPAAAAAAAAGGASTGSAPAASSDGAGELLQLLSRIFTGEAVTTSSTTTSAARGGDASDGEADDDEEDEEEGSGSAAATAAADALPPGAGSTLGGGLSLGGMDAGLLGILQQALVAGDRLGTGGTGGGGTGSVDMDALYDQPASKAAVAALKRVKIADAACRELPRNTTLVVVPPPGVDAAKHRVREVVAVPAAFSGPFPPAGASAAAADGGGGGSAAAASVLQSTLVVGTPATGAGGLTPAGADAACYAGRIVVLDRGAITFAQKALAAAAVGATAVVVVQSSDAAKRNEWPLTMVDGSGELKGAPAPLPVVMVSHADGEAIKALLADAAAATSAAAAAATTATDRAAAASPAAGGGGAAAAVHCRLVEGPAPGTEQCPVCQDSYGVGDEVVFMPCQHAFHDDCIAPWLAKRNTCPLCRHALPAEPVAVGPLAAAAAEAERQRGLQRERDAIAEGWYA